MSGYNKNAVLNLYCWECGELCETDGILQDHMEFEHGEQSEDDDNSEVSCSGSCCDHFYFKRFN